MDRLNFSRISTLAFSSFLTISILAFSPTESKAKNSKSYEGQNDSYKTSPNNTVNIMTYNVENLFDNTHDQGKEDWTFLPKQAKSGKEFEEACNKAKTGFYRDECFNFDYSDRVMQTKLNRISDTILSFNGVGADITILAEVENINILQKLNNEYLRKANYQTVALLEGQDSRGVDVGILSRYPLASNPYLHNLDITVSDTKSKDKNSGKRKLNTRGILEVPLRLPNNQVIHVFALHFPSQQNPTEARLQAVDQLRNILYHRQQQYPDHYMIVGGDFNIPSHENLRMQIYTKILGSIMGVSHILGCQSCSGTHNFRGDWDFLDVLLFSPNLLDAKSKVRLDVKSISTFSGGKFQLNPKTKLPARFDENSDVGVSDHLPVTASLSIQ